MPEVERWKNQSPTTAFVLKYDRYHEITSETVSSGRECTLSKEEREINQERAATNELDIFKNGILTPIKIIDPDDEKEFAANPNLMSGDELADLLKLSKKAFEAKIAVMTNIYPLQRLKDIAQKDDTRVTAGVLAALDARIAELKPAKPHMKSFADDSSGGLS
jgi:hypothetical protein